MTSPRQGGCHLFAGLLSAKLVLVLIVSAGGLMEIMSKVSYHKLLGTAGEGYKHSGGVAS